MNTKIKGCLLAVATAMVVGCGGGGAGGGASTPAGPKVGLYVTSSGGNYSHVWVSIKQVNVIGSGGTLAVFKNSTGKSIDLASLNQSGSKLFAALGVTSVPASSYSKVQVVLNNSVTVIPNGASQGTQGTFAGATGGSKTITFPTTFNGMRNLVANFNLANWSVSGTQVAATAQDDDGSQVSGGTQEPQDFQGPVANLSGTPPTLVFDISNDGTTTHVVTSATTVIANSDGSANPVLANNSVVDVIGTIDTTTNDLDATSIKIHVGSTHIGNDARGTVTTTSASTNSFVISVNGCDGILPNSSTVTVDVTSTTNFLDGSGLSITAAQFFTAAVAGTRIDAQGTYDSTSSTLTAMTVSINQDQGSHTQETQVVGPVVAIDTTNNDFTMTVQKYEGSLLTQGSTITVALTSTTNLNGLTLAGLTAGTSLEVQGTYIGTTLTAKEINTASSTGGDSGSGGGGGGGIIFHRSHK